MKKVLRDLLAGHIEKIDYTIQHFDPKIPLGNYQQPKHTSYEESQVIGEFVKTIGLELGDFELIGIGQYIVTQSDPLLFLQYADELDA